MYLFISATDCPIGTYSNLTGLANSSQCTPCDPGKYCPTPGLIEPYADCTAGHYCEIGSIEPAPVGQVYGYECIAGHYCEQGIASPTPCPKGTYNPDIGMVVIIVAGNFIIVD